MRRRASYLVGSRLGAVVTWLESVKKRPSVVRGEGTTHWYGVDVSPEERDLLVTIAEAAQDLRPLSYGSDFHGKKVVEISGDTWERLRSLLEQKP